MTTDAGTDPASGPDSRTIEQPNRSVERSVGSAIRNPDIMPKTPTAKVGKPGQEPGPCAACRAVAHRLQTTLHAAYRTHTEGDNDAVAMMMDRQEELPRASHRAAMNGVCEVWGMFCWKVGKGSMLGA